MQLLDSASATKAFLFAKQLHGTLDEVGARTNGFEELMDLNGTGEAEIVSRIAKTEAAGLPSVPCYVFNDAPFGWEHLSLIREKFVAQGLARTHAG